MKNKIIDILLVEDEEAHAELLRRAFERYPDKYLLNIVGTIRQARMILAESPPDIVIADMKLPDGDSIELLPGSIEQAEVPFIIITSYGDEHAAVTVIKNGALDYVPKSEEMLAKMPKIIERSLREWVNIVERKQAQVELRRLQNYLSNIIDSMPTLLIGLDTECKVTQWNKKAEEVTGIKAGEASGKALADVFPRMISETEKIRESIRTRKTIK